MGWDGYLLGPTLRAPYGANKKSGSGRVAGTRVPEDSSFVGILIE